MPSLERTIEQPGRPVEAPPTPERGTPTGRSRSRAPGKPRPDATPAPSRRRPPGAGRSRPVDPHVDPEPRRAARRSRSPSSSARVRELVPTTSAWSRSTIPALAHERDEIRYVYPHARSLVVHDRRGEQGRRCSRATCRRANHELYECEERLFEMGRTHACSYMNALGGDGLTTTIGWPQEVGQRWADKIWPLSHKLVAQAAGLGVIGTSRNFLHRRFGAYCLIDTVVTNLEFGRRTTRRVDWNPCLQCNLCVASCPTDAIKRRRRLRLLRLLQPHLPRLDPRLPRPGARPRRGASRSEFRKRWTDNEIAALWQAMAFRVEYRCFNCVATCPAEIEDAFHDDRDVRRALPRRDAEAAHAHARASRTRSS